jgi:hypothetical protein
MKNFADHFEYTAENDVFVDYCYYSYEPTVSSRDKFRSVNLLYHSFEVCGMDRAAFDLVQAIRESIGHLRTIWGVQQNQDRIKWEFYFYDYRREQRKLSISRILQVMQQFTACEIQPNENQLYFMFSIDIDKDLVSGNKSLSEIHIYIGNTAGDISSGISYALNPRGAALENFYFFLDPQKNQNEILSKIFHSAHIDPTKANIDEILWPELKHCKTICMANKPRDDCIYFSGLNIEQFLIFLRKTKYPAAIIDFVENNKSLLDHLQYDVGFDYRMAGDQVLISKSGYYGYF